MATEDAKGDALALRSLIRTCWNRLDSSRREAVYARFNTELHFDDDDYARNELGQFASGHGGGSSKGEGAGKGAHAGSGKSGKLGDPFGHPPPSTSKDNYKPDPTHDADKDGVTDAARVGIAGHEVTSTVPRMANLKEDERAVETRFASAFERDPKGMVDAYAAQVAAAKDPNDRTTFSTDDAKNLSPDYHNTIEGKALYNVATHQTSNAIAKQAFLAHLDGVAKLPEDKRVVLVTAGGCAAGKGYALKNAAADVKGRVAGVWDTAGEQNGTELPWVQKECEARGISVIHAYVDADPAKSFERVVSRAQGTPAKDGKAAIAPEGRMVDKLLFAESYVVGAANFRAFSESHKDNPRASFLILNNRTHPPSRLDALPHEATGRTVKEVHDGASAYVEANRGTLSEHVYRGATVSRHIWNAEAA